MNLEDLPKKKQYIIIDSNYITSGTKNNFTVSFGFESNTFVQEMKDVIGIKLVDFYVTQVGVNDTGTQNAAKFIDIYCPEIPVAGQMLSEQSGQIFARIPLERNFGGTGDVIVFDKQSKLFNRPTNLFNPLSIKNISFTLYEYQGDGDYILLKDTTDFYMVLEITTIDHKQKSPDKNIRLEQSIEKLNTLMEAFISKQKVETVEKVEKSKKIPFYYLGGIFAVIGITVLFLLRSGFFRNP